MSLIAVEQSKMNPAAETVRRRSTLDGSDAKKTACSSGKIKGSKSQGRKPEMSSYHKRLAIWREFISKHRKDLRQARPVVDDKPPMLSISPMYDQRVLRLQQRRIMSFYAANPAIIKSLHQINVFGGRTETFAFDYAKRSVPSNFDSRRRRAEDIERENKILLEMIDIAEPRLPRVKEYARMWKQMEGMIESGSHFPLFWKARKKGMKEASVVEPSGMHFRQFVTEKSGKYPDKRPRVFFEISIKNVGAIGKMVAVLFSDHVPMTVKNFLAFCNPKAELTYKGCFFYLIFQNFFCQTGDVVENKGFGGTSIYGPYFGDEDHALRHGERGVLTMFNKIPNRNQCQFLITFRELKSLDGTNVVFGKIVKGFHVLDAIESVGSKITGRPKVDIFISDCDEI